jgi:hypothetical protein
MTPLLIIIENCGHRLIINEVMTPLSSQATVENLENSRLQ